MVKNIGEIPDKNEIRAIEKKLDKCRCSGNDPASEEYRIKMNQQLMDDDDAPSAMEYHLGSPDRSDVSMINISQFGSE